jgi:TPR repeat protein
MKNIALIVCCIAFLICGQAEAATRSMCPDKVLNTGTIEGIFLGVECIDMCYGAVKLPSGENFVLLMDEDEAEKVFGKGTGQKVSITYNVEQFWNEYGEICSRLEAFASGKLLTDAKSGQTVAQSNKPDLKATTAITIGIYEAMYEHVTLSIMLNKDGSGFFEGEETHNRIKWKQDGPKLLIYFFGEEDYSDDDFEESTAQILSTTAFELDGIKFTFSAALTEGYFAAVPVEQQSAPAAQVEQAPISIKKKSNILTIIKIGLLIICAIFVLLFWTFRKVIIESYKEWKLVKAAEQGDADTQYQLGLWYIHRGGEFDKGNAARWFRKAVAQGHDKARVAAAEYGISLTLGHPEAAGMYCALDASSFLIKSANMKRFVDELNELANDERVANDERAIEILAQMTANAASHYLTEYEIDLYDPVSSLKKNSELDDDFFEDVIKLQEHGEHDVAMAMELWAHTISGVRYPMLYAPSKQIWRALSRAGEIRYPKGFELES